MNKDKFKELYLTDNKTGKYSKDINVKKNHPEIYEQIVNYCNKFNFNDITFKEKVYLFVNEINTIPVCKECGDKVNYSNNKEGYKKFCSGRCSAINIESKEKFLKTNLEKYGVEHPKKSQIVKNKYKETCLNKYGVDHISKTDKWKNAFKKTCLEKYGVENVFSSEKIKEKIKKTLIEKYGVEHPLQNKIFKDKQYNTSVEKYGCYYNDTEEYKEKFKINFINQFKDKLEIISISNENLCECKCDCGKEHTFISPKYVIYNRIRSGLKVCNICNSTYYVSGGQIEVKNYIEQYFNTKLSDRKTINGELDIYIPELKLAFEFNGLWWHNELNKEKNYHLNKTEECEKQGIKLIHIWEDDWILRKNIVKSMILNKLGKIENKIYARKCEIKEVNDNKLIKKFLEKNHIQGFTGSKIKLGLFYNDELVSLMTLGNRRIAMGKNKTNDGEYELLRFCNKLNNNVVGGASKLFKYFINNYNPKKITTYADRSFSQGNLYKQLGFNFIKKTEPNYYYIVEKMRYHRFNFRKDKLIKEGFDSNKTEHEIMLDRKIYRIYDSGNLKYSISF